MFKGGESMSLDKYRGIIPALYACYDDDGNVCEVRTKTFANYLFKKGINGLYVGGSSGECIYQNITERKATLKYVSEELNNKITLIAHIGAPSTRESVELAKYAESLGYDALSAIPPIYYQLPERAIYKYWTAMIQATSIPFFIYNIPQTTGYHLSIYLLKKMLAYERVIGVKNSSMPAMDIERFKRIGGKDFIVLNGPDEQYLSGRLIGADGGIGGTYGVMPELFLQLEHSIMDGDLEKAKTIQSTINDIIIALTSLDASMYAVIKKILELRGVKIGSVRKPLESVHSKEMENIENINQLILNSIEQIY